MSKKFVTGASFALGGAGIALVGYLSANPLAFTHPVAPLPFEAAPSNATLLHATAPKLVTDIVLPEVTIAAAIPRSEKVDRNRSHAHHARRCDRRS
jgi:hypothetical protein